MASQKLSFQIFPELKGLMRNQYLMKDSLVILPFCLKLIL